MQHNSRLTSRSQELRRNMTKEERRLWYEYLRDYPCQFRRQVTCGSYILDFYCAAAKLAIELDGSQHFDLKQLDYDAQRTAYLNRLGIQVLRFSNLDILRNLRGVCQMIDTTVAERMKKIAPSGHLTRPFGAPSPKGRALRIRSQLWHEKNKNPKRRKK